MQSENLIKSGIENIAVDAVFAVIGAVGLQRGGDAARRVVENRILAAVKEIPRAG